jgi:hypothetical protein
MDFAVMVIMVKLGDSEGRNDSRREISNIEIRRLVWKKWFGLEIGVQC